MINEEALVLYWYLTTNEWINAFLFINISRLLFRTIDLLWNLLEYSDEEQIINQLNSRVTLRLIIK